VADLVADLVAPAPQVVAVTLLVREIMVDQIQVEAVAVAAALARLAEILLILAVQDPAVQVYLRVFPVHRWRMPVAVVDLRDLVY
jgi:hypothetical protein